MTIPDRQKELDRFIAQHFPKPARAPESNGSAYRFKPSPPRSDEQVIQACRAAKNAAKFADLYDHGDVDRYHAGDDSSADAGLMEILAFQTQDEDQLEYLFSQSALGQREKWNKRPDYRRRTIKYVLGELRDTWQPHGNDSARLIVGGSSKAEPQDFIYSRHTHMEFGENKSEPPKPLPIKTIEEVIEEAGEEVPWIIECLLARGALTDVSGVAKDSGKTTFVCHAIAASARGDNHGGFDTKPAKFLYLTEQGNNFALALRDSGLEDYPDHIRILQFKDVTAVQWNTLMHQAGAEVKRRGLDVLVVDTFAVFARLKGSEENDAGPVADRMRVLRLIAQKYDIAVLLIRHAGKDGTPRGSSAFEAEADICIHIGKPEGRHDPRVRRLSAKGRYGVWERNVQLVDGRYISLGTDDRVEFNKAVAFIKATLPEEEAGAMRQRELMELRSGPDEEITARTLHRALMWLVGKEAVGEKQLVNERGKPKVYWLLEDAFIYSRQTPSPNGENKSNGENPTKEAGLTEEQEQQIRKLMREGTSEKWAREEVLGKGWVPT